MMIYTVKSIFIELSRSKSFCRIWVELFVNYYNMSCQTI